MSKPLLPGLLFCLQLLCQAPLAAAPGLVDGSVTKVIDGDSVWFAPLAGGEALQVRLLGIDAPEICQPWGEQARQELAERVLGKPLRIDTQGLDSYGRTLATLFVDGQSINKTMVQEGHAWSTRYKHDRGPFVADERMAKALSRGFNREGGAIEPKTFRRTHGPCENGLAAQADLPAAAPAARAAPAGAPAPVVASNAAYRCDARTYCSQMRSCAEATFFLRHCPGVKMDGNNDGVPCERQWCRP